MSLCKVALGVAFMTYCYLVYMYHPKHKYGDMIFNGYYDDTPKVFLNYKAALDFQKSYKHASYIKKVKLYE